MNSAIIVLFNPDLVHLNGLINSLLSQVDNVILVDNTPVKNQQYDFLNKDQLNKKIIYVDLNGNLGIAKAHNAGISKALELGSEYLVIFDQDSTVDQDFVSSLIATDHEIRKSDIQVAAVGPAYIDTKTNIKAPIIQFNGLKVNRIYPNEDEQFTIADYIISSGTLIRTDVFKTVGLMMEELFIDYVDLEWGLRAKKLGYHCFVANKVIMKHSIGDESIKVPFSKKYVNIHSDFRKYFIIRNAFYLIFYSNLQWNWRVVQIPKTFMYFFFLFLFVSPRINNLKIFLLALKDALTKKMDKGSM